MTTEKRKKGYLTNTKPDMKGKKKMKVKEIVPFLSCIYKIFDLSISSTIFNSYVSGLEIKTDEIPSNIMQLNIIRMFAYDGLIYIEVRSGK